MHTQVHLLESLAPDLVLLTLCKRCTRAVDPGLLEQTDQNRLLLMRDYDRALNTPHPSNSLVPTYLDMVYSQA